MKPVAIGLSLLALAGVLAGCTINDPTENEFAPQIINKHSIDRHDGLLQRDFLLRERSMD